MKKAWQFFTTDRGSQYWNLFIRATGIAGLVGIPLVLYFPDSVPLVWLWLVGIPANSPIAPLFPTAFEPLMMEVVKYKPVLTVALAAVAIFVYMEFVNWYAFSWLLSWDKFEKVRHHHWVKWGVKRYSGAPLRTVFFFAATPIPFWIVRSLAILHKTAFIPYMIVMAFGRFPRLLIYAWLGSQIQLPTWILFGFALGTGVALMVWRLIRGRPFIDKTVLDLEPDPVVDAPTI